MIWAPSETDDALAVWLPDDGLLLGGAATPGFTIPNIGTPLRTQRFTIRWAETLDRLGALGATRLLTEFGPLIEGDDIDEQLARTAEALRWIRDEVVERMNAGMSEGEILADITYPDELFDRPWMRPTYGAPDYIVRDVYREENGWWDRNPTTLHPAPPAEAAAAVLSAIADPQAVLDRARALADDGQTQLALHVVDLLALGPRRRAGGRRSPHAQGRVVQHARRRDRRRTCPSRVTARRPASSPPARRAGNASPEPRPGPICVGQALAQCPPSLGGTHWTPSGLWSEGAGLEITVRQSRGPLSREQ